MEQSALHLCSDPFPLRLSVCLHSYLQQELPFTGVLDEAGNQTGGAADDEGAIGRLFGMRTQKERSQNVIDKQRIAAVTGKTQDAHQGQTLGRISRIPGGGAYIAMLAQHHTAWASASSVSAKLGVRDLGVGDLPGSFPVSQMTPEMSTRCREMLKEYRWESRTGEEGKTFKHTRDPCERSVTSVAQRPSNTPTDKMERVGFT